MLDCCGRCSQHQSVAELSVHGKSQSAAEPPGNVSPTDELPRVWSVGPSACPSFAAVLLHDVLPDLSPGVVSPTVRHPSFAAMILGWKQALAPGRQRSAAHARQSPRTHVCRVQPSILPPSLPLSSSCKRVSERETCRFSARDTLSVFVGRVADMDITQQQDTELYIYLYVSCICLRIYLYVYMWHIHRCVFPDATAGTSDAGGLSNVWCKEADQTHDHTGGLSPDPY